jgi:hypothetical protein
MTALTAEQISVRLHNDEYGYHEGGDDWDYELAEWLSEIDIDAAIAWAHAEEDHDSEATFEPTDVAERFRSVYRGYHESAWEFARDSWAVNLQEFGDTGERKGREAFMNDFSPYIDWRAVADSPLLSDYSMVKLGGADDARVHVFELNV